MNWFLYDNGLRHERVKGSSITKVLLYYSSITYLLISLSCHNDGYKQKLKFFDQMWEKVTDINPYSPTVIYVPNVYLLLAKSAVLCLQRRLIFQNRIK